VAHAHLVECEGESVGERVVDDELREKRVCVGVCVRMRARARACVYQDARAHTQNNADACTQTAHIGVAHTHKHPTCVHADARTQEAHIGIAHTHKHPTCVHADARTQEARIGIPHTHMRIHMRRVCAHTHTRTQTRAHRMRPRTHRHPTHSVEREAWSFKTHSVGFAYWNLKMFNVYIYIYI
jgi:hypothetical protein